MNDLATENPPPQLKKHVATVHTSAPLSLVQRKAFSVLVFHAYPMLLKRKEHEIPINLFCDLIGFDSKNIPVLEESLNQLAQTRINWEDGEGKKRRWGVTTFLAYAEMRGGACHYEFSEFLARELFQPDIYARINIGALRDFESKYGIALYENCARYRPNGEFKGNTPEWPLSLFRRLMGVEDSPYYGDFKRMNERVLKPAIKEVNAYSDISVEPRLKKQGRAVVAVAFHVRNNSKLKLSAKFADDAHPLALEAYNRYSVPLLKAAEWLQTYGEGRFSEVLGMTNELTAQGKIKRPVGFMRKALEDGYLPPPDLKEGRKKQAERKTAPKSPKPDKAEIERARLEEEELAAAAIARFEALPAEEQEEIVDTLSAENSFFRDRYARQGREKLLKGTLRLVLVHWLEEKWALRAETQ